MPHLEQATPKKNQNSDIAPSPFEPQISLQYRHPDSYISSDEDYQEGSCLVDKIAARRQQQAQRVRNPMSSSVRSHRHASFHELSPTGCKYTLRSGGYVPFRKTLEKKRALKQLQQRGGSEQMEKFVSVQEERKWKESWRRRANEDPVKVEDIEAHLEELERIKHEQYEKELEKMLQDEEDELDELFGNMNLGR